MNDLGCFPTHGMRGIAWYALKYEHSSSATLGKISRQTDRKQLTFVYKTDTPQRLTNRRLDVSSVKTTTGKCGGALLTITFFYQKKNII